MIRFNMTIGKADEPDTYTRIAFRLPDFVPYRQEQVVNLAGVYPYEGAARMAAFRWIREARRQHDETLQG